MAYETHRDLHEPMRLFSSYAGTVHWVSAFVGPDRGNGRNRQHVQLTDVLSEMDLDYEEAVSLHAWLGTFLKGQRSMVGGGEVI